LTGSNLWAIKKNFAFTQAQPLATKVETESKPKKPTLMHQKIGLKAILAKISMG
jgi:hypothetical protein